VRVVDLEQKSGIDNGAIFLTDRLGEREQIVFFAPVEGVAVPVLDARHRRRRHESLGHIHMAERRLEIVEVGLQLHRALVGDGSGADEMLVPRMHVLELRRVEVRKGLDLARPGPRALVAVGRVDLEAAEAIVDVRDEARLAHLAVADDIDAEIGLLLDDRCDGLRHARAVAGFVDRLAALTGGACRDEIGRPRQAADMGGQDAIGALAHEAFSRPFLF
jgi:hypothetical protein